MKTPLLQTGSMNPAASPASTQRSPVKCLFRKEKSPVAWTSVTRSSPATSVRLLWDSPEGSGVSVFRLHFHSLECLCVEHNPNTSLLRRDRDYPNPSILSSNHLGKCTVDPWLTIDVLKVSKERKLPKMRIILAQLETRADQTVPAGAID